MAEAPPTPFRVVQRTLEVSQVKLYLQLIAMDRTLLVWVNTSPSLGPLSMAMPAPPQVPGPLLSQPLLGQRTDDSSERLALLLAKRSGYQVFASCALPELPDDHFFTAVVQAAVAELRELCG